MKKLVLYFISVLLLSSCVTTNTRLKDDKSFNVREGKDYLLDRDAYQIR